MRLFEVITKSEDLNTSFDMEDKTNQADLAAAYTQLTPPGTTSIRIEDTNARNGTGSASGAGSSAGDYIYVYTLLNKEKNFPMELSFFSWWNGFNLTPAAGESISFSVTLYTDATHYVRNVIGYEGEPGSGQKRYGISGSWRWGGSNDSHTYVSGVHSSAWRGIKVILEADGTIKWFGDNGAGSWTLFATDSLGETFTPVYLHIELGVGADTVFPYDSAYIDDVIFTPGPQTGDEITGVIGASCSKALKGEGMFSAKVRDKELATYATYKNKIWTGFEVYKNDLSMKLGEYFCIRPEFRYNSALFQGPEAVRILDHIATNYNGLLATGIVTALADDYIDDNKAAFTDALLTKIILFNDVVAPNIETAYPNSDSNHYKTLDDNLATPFAETGDETKLDTDTTGPTNYWSFVYESSADNDTFYHKLVFPVVEGAAAVAFSLTLKAFLEVASSTFEPEIYIYDFTNTVWRLLSEWEFRGQYYTYNFTDADIPAGVISDYYSGDATPEFHIKITSGETVTNVEQLRIITSFTELKTTFSTLFAAETTNYIIDSRTGTRLIATGQTPLADGVAVDDTYKVGDYLHTIMQNIFANGYNTSLTLDYDDSTRADAQDYRTDTIGSVLIKYAELEEREYWQQKGWRVQCKSSYESTGITITENHCVVDKDMEKWVITRDGSEMVRHVQVVGNGVFLEGFQNPTYATPQTFLHTDKRISSAVIASEWATTLLSKYSDVLESITLTVDYDDGNDWTEVDVGKTINVNLFSGTFQLTNALITKVAYADQADGNLQATLTIEAQ